METTFKKRPSFDTAEEKNKDKQQLQSDSKEIRKDKQWWEQFIGAIPEDKEYEPSYNPSISSLVYLLHVK